MHVAAQLGRPVVLIHGDDEFGSSDLVGGQLGFRSTRVVDNFIHSVMKTEENVSKTWVDHRLTNACKYGFTVIYDEFNRSRPEANNVLLGVLEERLLEMPAGRVSEGYLHVHPGFRAIFTSNPEEYAGVHKTQDALLDRMITITVGQYDRETEVADHRRQVGPRRRGRRPDRRHRPRLPRAGRPAADADRPGLHHDRQGHGPPRRRRSPATTGSSSRPAATSCGSTSIKITREGIPAGECLARRDPRQALPARARRDRSPARHGATSWSRPTAITSDELTATSPDRNARGESPEAALSRAEAGRCKRGHRRGARTQGRPGDPDDGRRWWTPGGPGRPPGALLELSAMANEKLLLHKELDRWKGRHVEIRGAARPRSPPRNSG